MEIFLAFPFTLKLQNDGLLSDTYILELTSLKAELMKRGHEVIFAHEREKWGKELLPPEVCTNLDFNDILRSDIIVAYPGNTPSGGVHIELGWASALGKKIVILKYRKEKDTPLIEGLRTITESVIIELENGSNLSQTSKQILEIIENMSD